MPMPSAIQSIHSGASKAATETEGSDSSIDKTGLHKNAIATSDIRPSRSKQ